MSEAVPLSDTEAATLQGGPSSSSPVTVAAPKRTESKDNSAPQDAAEAADLKLAYWFLMQRKVPELRLMARSADVKQGALKNSLIANLLAYVRKCRKQGKKVTDILSMDVCKNQFELFSRMWKSLERSRADPDWSSLKSMESLCSPRRRRVRETTTDKTPSQSSVIPFSNSDFARLLLIIVHEEEPRAALLASGKELTRHQLDSDISRDAFWTTIVAKKFNDHSWKCALTFEGCVDGLRADLPPPQQRDGPFLKEKFTSNRKVFSEVYDRWSRSGQNETDNFSDFVPTLRDETPTAESIRAILTFSVLRCGQPDSDDEMLDFILRQAGGSSGKGYESGIKEFNHVNRDSKKRKRDSLNAEADKAVEVLEKSSGQLEEILSFIKSRMEAMSGPMVSKEERGRMGRHERKQKLLDMLESVEKYLGLAPNDPDNAFRKALHVQRDELLQEFQTLSTELASNE